MDKIAKAISKSKEALSNLATPGATNFEQLSSMVGKGSSRLEIARMGIVWEDIVFSEERRPEIRELMRRLPKEYHEARQWRRVRASDLHLKRTELTEEEQSKLEENEFEGLAFDVFQHLMKENNDARFYRRDNAHFG